MRNYRQTIYVDDITEIEIKPPKGRVRKYLLLENRSANSVDFNYCTHADSLNGTEIQATQTYEQIFGVSNDYIYIRGRGATGSRQQVNITEGFDD